MKTKNEIIIQLKKAHPFLRLGSEEQGYSQLNSEEYEAQINEWAEAELAKQETDIEASAKKAAAEAKLALLGLDAEDLKVLGLG